MTKNSAIPITITYTDQQWRHLIGALRSVQYDGLAAQLEAIVNSNAAPSKPDPVFNSEYQDDWMTYEGDDGFDHLRSIHPYFDLDNELPDD